MPKRGRVRSPEIDDRPRDNSRMRLARYNVSTFRHVSAVVLSLARKFNYTYTLPAGVYWQIQYLLIGIINYTTKRVYRIPFSSPPFSRGILPTFACVYIYLRVCT